MEVTASQVIHTLVSLIKYVVALILLWAGATFVLPIWGSTCAIDSEDLGMREALGKTRLKIGYNPGAWNEAALKRGDIVIAMMMAASASGERNMQKFPFRVVAVEGDVIEAPRGALTINGEKEEYTAVSVRTNDALRVAKQRVPRGYAYVLPDDRVSNKGGLPCLIPVWRIVGKVEEL